MDESGVKEFLSRIETHGNPGEFLDRRRRESKEIAEGVELAETYADGRTTHRAVAHSLDISRDMVFHLLAE